MTTLAPDNSDGHYLHGNALKEAGDSKAAEKAYRRALEIDPNHAEAEEALAKLK